MTQETPSVRASDAEREQAVELLRTHAVDGRLTLSEFAERIESAYGARTRDELEELTKDLPATANPAQGESRRRWLLTILGGTERRGRFRLGRTTTALTLLGGHEIDLRDARIESADSTLTVVTILGGTEITVPEGVDVEVDGLALLGGKEYRPGTHPVGPDAPRLRIRAYAFLGGVEIRTRPPRT